MTRFSSPSWTAALRTASGASLLPLLAAPYAAWAAWETVPEISMSVATDDNTLLDSQGGQDTVSRTELDAAIRLSSFGERGTAYIEPRIVTDAYVESEAKDFESDDVFFDSGGQYNWRTVGVGFRARYSEQILINAEFEDAIPEDPDLDPGNVFTDPDTGRLLLFDESRERFDVRGNIDFRISERNRLRFELTRQDVAYTGPPVNARSDFDDDTLAVSIVRNVDERNVITARMFTSEFYSVRNDNTTNSVGIEGTFSRPLAPNWTMTLTAGVQRNEYDFLSAGNVRVGNAITNERFALYFRKRGERTDWNLDFSHAAQPQGGGFLTLRDTVGAFVRPQFTQRLTGRFGIRTTVSETLDDLRTQDDRDYSRVELGVEWAWKPTVFVTGGYSHTKQDFVNELTNEADRNQIFIGVRYQGLSRRNQ